MFSIDPHEFPIRREPAAIAPAVAGPIIRICVLDVLYAIILRISRSGIPSAIMTIFENIFEWIASHVASVADLNDARLIHVSICESVGISEILGYIETMISLFPKKSFVTLTRCALGSIIPATEGDRSERKSKSSIRWATSRWRP